MIPEAPKKMIQYLGGSDWWMSQPIIIVALQVDATAHKAITGPIELLNETCYVW